MFPSRYFSDRYFAPRYWPKVGAGGFVSSDSGEVIVVFRRPQISVGKERSHIIRAERRSAIRRVDDR